MRFFTWGNVWLLLAVVLILGRNVARTSPTRYSFFGTGAWLTPFTYHLLVLLCVVLGVFLLRHGLRDG